MRLLEYTLLILGLIAGLSALPLSAYWNILVCRECKRQGIKRWPYVLLPGWFIWFLFVERSARVPRKAWQLVIAYLTLLGTLVLIVVILNWDFLRG